MNNHRKHNAPRALYVDWHALKRWILLTLLCTCICTSIWSTPHAAATPLFKVHRTTDDQPPVSLLHEVHIDDEVAKVNEAANYGLIAPVTRDNDAPALATTVVCPAICQSTDSLRVNVHTSLPPTAARAAVTCTLQANSPKRTIAQTNTPITSDNQDTQVIQFELDLAQLHVQAGVYQVVIEQTCATPEQLLTARQTATLIIYEAAQTTNVGIICQMEAPPAVSVQGIPFDQQAAQLTQQAAQLNELLDILEAQEHLHLTLATTWMTLEDMRALAEPPETRIAQATEDPSLPSQNTAASTPRADDLPAKEQTRMAVLQRTLARMETLAAAGKLEIVCNGYADPHPDLVDHLKDYTLITRQYEAPQACDWRKALNVPIAVGAAPLTPPSSTDALLAYARGNVGWMALAQGHQLSRGTVQYAQLSPEDRDALNHMLVLPYDPSTTQALQSGDVNRVVNEVAQVQESADNIPALFCFSLSPDTTNQQTQAFKTLLGLVAHHPSLHTQSCNELISQAQTGSLGTALDLVLQADQAAHASQDDSSSDAQIASIKLVAADAHELTQALQVAGPDLAQTHQAQLSFLKGLSAAYMNDAEGQIGQLELASERVRGFFSKVSVSVQAQHLTGADGVIAVVVKNNSDEKLNLLIQPETSATLDLSDANMHDGISISSVAGENFKQIPVRLNSSGQELEQTPPTLTINICAGDYIISSQTVDITSSRYDLTLYLFIIIGVLIALIVLLRLRLHQFGMTEETDLEHLDKTVQEIKEELIAEEPRVIEAIGDIEGHDEASEQKMTATDLQELIEENHTESFERLPGDQSAVTSSDCPQHTPSASAVPQSNRPPS